MAKSTKKQRIHDWKIIVDTAFMHCARGNLSEQECLDLIDSGEYVLETKFDGVRAQIHRDGEKVDIWTRNGINLAHQLPHIVEAVKKYPGDFGPDKLILDGELVSSNFSFTSTVRALSSNNLVYLANLDFYCFDVISCPEFPGTHSLPYTERHELLNNMRLYSPIVVVGNSTDTELNYSARELFHLICEAGKEGVVLKRKNSPYIPGRSDAWLRCKFKNTISVHPFDVLNNHMVGIGVYKADGSVVDLGNIQVPAEDLILMLQKDLNVVIEVEAYGVAESGKLRHPVFKGIRLDIDLVSCSADQLDSLRTY